MPSPLIIAVAAAGIAALTALKRRRAYARQLAQQQPEPPASPGLPPLSRGQALAVMNEAEKAAIRHALGGTPEANPHPEGTRAHIIWAAHYGATQLDWEH
ncbi:MAG: hypothetical protein ABI919_00090 [Ramlibacter sp.]